jgi:hypothetical protein
MQGREILLVRGHKNLKNGFSHFTSLPCCAKKLVANALSTKTIKHIYNWLQVAVKTEKYILINFKFCQSRENF